MSFREDDDRVMQAYYDEVRGLDQLKVDEERALFKAYRTCTKCNGLFPLGEVSKCLACGTRRNYAARDRIICSVLKFAVKMAKDYARKAKGAKYDPELLKSLVSAGNLGTLVAADKFDLAMGTRFLTYAAWWMREKIMEELDNMGLVRVPAYRQKALRARRKQGDMSAAEEAPYVVMEELSTIETKEREDDLESTLLNNYGSSLIFLALSELNFRGRDKYIVITYFGMRETAKNLRQIADRLDMSSERVRQIKKDALDRLKAYLATQQIRQSHDVYV